MNLKVISAAAAVCFTSVAVFSVSTSGPVLASGKPDRLPGGYKHLVVIYAENHSFDNLYGSWGSVGKDEVDGVSNSTAAQRTQVARNGTPFTCLLQNDVNLASPTPLPTTCTDAAHGVAASAFGNTLFAIDDYIKPEDNTCPLPGLSAPNGVLKDSAQAQTNGGGCTRDLVHRFYNEQFQLDGGKQDRYTLGSDAAGLTQGVYNTARLPMYRYLHSHGAPRYVVADRFFQSSFGGSFLNHQFLIAARAPVWASWTTAGQAHSVLDSNGMPAATPLYANTVGRDNALTQACDDASVVVGIKDGRACGNVAVNTVQPFSQPFVPGVADGKRLPLVDDTTYPNIGDELSAKGVSWNWFSGGWDNAAGNVGGAGWTNGTTPGTCTDPDHRASDTYPNCAGNLFQYHHQPFNYFANYAPGTPGRTHLKDEVDFEVAVATGTLPAVSFVKPYGAENEHPGYASEADGNDHLVNLIKSITEGPQAGNTLVVVTYDEFGGQWDHVPPPGEGSTTTGYHDVWGPGTRIPALVISRSLTKSGVDHTVYDTTSILSTIEHSYGLAPLSPHDAAVNDLSNAVSVGGRRVD